MVFTTGYQRYYLSLTRLYLQISQLVGNIKLIVWIVKNRQARFGFANRVSPYAFIIFSIFPHVLELIYVLPYGFRFDNYHLRVLIDNWAMPAGMVVIELKYSPAPAGNTYGTKSQTFAYAG